MVDESKYGTDWTADELDAIVADYFLMLQHEHLGLPYIKARRRADLVQRIGRTSSSIERKHGNISAVLLELGMPTIKGYKPYPNFQNAIFQAIDRYLSQHPDPVPISADANFGFAEPPGLFLEAPPGPALMKPRSHAGLERLVRKFDPALRDERNRLLGKAGEELIYGFERRRLEQLERPDLARRVRWVSQEDGDGAGYDILSFDAGGKERLIEVKTTQGMQRTPFYLTRNERTLSDERPDAFRLYRLYRFSRQPRLFELAPPLDAALTLEPLVYKASLTG